VRVIVPHPAGQGTEVAAHLRGFADKERAKWGPPIKAAGIKVA